MPPAVGRQTFWARNKLLRVETGGARQLVARLVAVGAVLATATCAAGEATQGLSITHVFSTFAPPTAQGLLEAGVVQQSWAEAARFAETTMPGFRVDMINLVLPEDKDTAANLSRLHRTVLLERPVTNIEGQRVPAIGEIFARASELAETPWIVYTNADIGLAQNFYLRLHDIIQEYQHPTLKATAQDLEDASVMHETCLAAMEKTLSCARARALCDADATEWWANSRSGSRSLEATSLLAQHLRNAVRTSTRMIKCRRSEHQPSRGAEPLALIEIAMHKLRLAAKDQNWALAGTITRVNLQDLAVKRLFAGQNATRVTLNDLQRELVVGGESHPGNDCFFFQKGRVPQPVTSLLHPMGMRPWGMWLPWQFQHGRAGAQEWRRFVGSPREVWTFHLGVSLDLWRTQARSSYGGAFILGLAANWFNATNQMYATSFRDVPWFCKSAERWRDKAFCSSTPPSYCRGRVHLGCDGFKIPELRTTRTYLRLCRELGLVNKISRKEGDDGTVPSSAVSSSARPMIPASPHVLRVFCKMLADVAHLSSASSPSSSHPASSTRSRSGPGSTSFRQRLIDLHSKPSLT